MNDVWTLETLNEQIAIDTLDMAVTAALDGDANAQRYLCELWPEDSWKTIKERLESEGSTWYVWYMDGVRQHMANEAKAESEVTHRLAKEVTQ